MPTITIKVTSCRDCPLLRYMWEQELYCCMSGIPDYFRIGKDTGEETEETFKKLSWEKGQPEFCPAQ